MTKPTPLLERLTGDNEVFTRIPSVVRAIEHLERALAQGGGRISTTEVFEGDSGGPMSKDLRIATNALRTCGAMELVASYPTRTGALEVGEPKSSHLLAFAARGLLTGRAAEAIKVHFVLREPGRPPMPESGVSRQVHGGEEFGPADLEQLLKNLSSHCLDPGINLIDDEGRGTFRFHGNFTTLSAVFNVRSNDPFVVLALTAAMDANRQRPDYLADVETRESAARDYHAMLQATGNTNALREARAEWAATRPHVACQVLRREEPAPARRPKP